MTRALPALLLALLPALAAAQVAPALTPGEAEAGFRAANDACLKDDAAACIDGYERLLAAGWSGADLEFNLGTAYLKSGRLGPAVLHLERALRLDPDDADARANLLRATRMRVDKLVGSPEETGGEESLAARVVSRTSGDRWALAFLAFWLAAGLALGTRFLVSHPGARTGLLAAFFALAAASVPCATVTGLHFSLRDRAREAIVIAPSLPVREGPRESYKAPFDVHEGLKVRVLDEEGAFRRIRLLNGLQGWVPASGIEEIGRR